MTDSALQEAKTGKFRAQFNDHDDFKKQYNVYSDNLSELKRTVRNMNYSGIAIWIDSSEPGFKGRWYKPRKH